MPRYNYQMFLSNDLSKFCLGRTTGEENNDVDDSWEYLNCNKLQWDSTANDCWEESFQYLLEIARKGIPQFYFSFFNHNYC